ncbi:MAG: hypothetical protein HY053_00850 [Proteobacteria bacterium]|nr:hypothetical protein [Pseudomonadota bacterium]
MTEPVTFDPTKADEFFAARWFHRPFGWNLSSYRALEDAVRIYREKEKILAANQAAHNSQQAKITSHETKLEQLKTEQLAAINKNAALQQHLQGQITGIHELLKQAGKQLKAAKTTAAQEIKNQLGDYKINQPLAPLIREGVLEGVREMGLSDSWANGVAEDPGSNMQKVAVKLVDKLIKQNKKFGDLGKLIVEGHPPFTSKDLKNRERMIRFVQENYPAVYNASIDLSDWETKVKEQHTAAPNAEIARLEAQLAELNKQAGNTAAVAAIERLTGQITKLKKDIGSEKETGSQRNILAGLSAEVEKAKGQLDEAGVKAAYELSEAEMWSYQKGLRAAFDLKATLSSPSPETQTATAAPKKLPFDKTQRSGLRGPQLPSKEALGPVGGEKPPQLVHGMESADHLRAAHRPKDVLPSAPRPLGTPQLPSRAAAEPAPEAVQPPPEERRTPPAKIAPKESAWTKPASQSERWQDRVFGQ